MIREVADVDMVCSACGATPVSGKFCSECGAGLTVLCPACGAPAAGKFCSECGTALHGASSGTLTVAGVATATERRVCSVLFGDLVGFTPLSEARDPEVVRELLSRYFDTARTVITRYGGVVEKFIGDAVMAVWGTPVATEGDAERAVRAALDLVAAVDALGEEVGAEGLALRAGIVTGEVAVTLGATGEGMVAGDAVNTAARVQSAAAPRQVWVDEHTRRLTVAAIALDDVGQHVLKGKAEPQHLFRAIRVLSGVGGSQRVDGLEAPLVGRDSELRLLKDAFHATADRRTPRLVVVSGPAGAGKSRLGWEFEKYIDGLADVSWWHRGRCLSYGEGIAYWALAEMIRQRFGIAEEDPLDVAAAKLTEQLPRFVVDSAERAYVGPRLARLLGVAYPGAPDSVLTRDELFAGWRVFFERLAETGPVVLLIEDAQYADAALLDFVDHLTDWARNAPIYVVVFTRQELVDARPGFGVGRNRSLIALDLLDPRSMETMVDALVPGMPGDAVATITAQAQGNPLFAIEMVRALIDRDVVVPREGRYVLVGDIRDLGVPDSLHGLLAARLDALDADSRSLLADAAVLGTLFPADALVAVSGRPRAQVEAALTDLVRRGVLEISADPLSPQSGSYMFAQNLLRQVAYDTMSRRERKARHLAVAAHLQVAFDGDEIMAVVAQHYLDALAAVENDVDDDAISAKAVDALLRAAARAQGAGAPRRATTHFDRAAELVARSPGRELEAARLWERAAASGRAAGDHDEQYRLAQRARDIHRTAGRAHDAARAATMMAVARANQGQLKPARDLLEPAVEQLRSAQDGDTVQGVRELAAVLVFGGDPERGADLAREALSLAQALDLPDGTLADVLVVSGIASIFLNRWVESEAMLIHAVRLAERADDSTALTRALMNLSALKTALSPGTSLEYSLRSYELSRRIGAAFYMRTATYNMMSALVFSGEWDVAEEQLRRIVDQDGLEPDDEWRANTAALAALRGDLETARVNAGDLEGLRRSDDAQYAILVACLDALVEHAAGFPAQALERGRQVLAYAGVGLANEYLILTWALLLRAAKDIDDRAAVAELVDVLDSHPPGHVPPLLRAERNLARAWLGAARGDDEATVDRGFADALAQLRAFGSPYHLAHGLLDHAERHRAAGRPAEADAAIAEASAIAERLGARTLAARAGALSAAEVRT